MKRKQDEEEDTETPKILVLYQRFCFFLLSEEADRQDKEDVDGMSEESVFQHIKGIDNSFAILVKFQLKI